MVVATCMNSSEYIRYGVLHIPNDESSAKAGTGITMSHFEET
jgi:hypothetical protein